MAVIPIAFFVAVAAGSAFVILSSRGSGGSSGKPGSGGFKSSPGEGGVTPPGERLQWDSWSKSLAIADVNGDGVEDILGRYKILDIASSTQTTFAGAFDGKTFKRIWKTAPLGSHSQSVSATFVGVAGDRAVVSDYQSQVHILELATGKPLLIVKLSDRAQAICSPPDGRREVWVQVADNRHVTIDVAAGRAILTPIPAWCEAAARSQCGDGAGEPLRGELCETESKDYSKYQSAGFSPQMMIRNDGLAIVVGTKSPGTAIPIVAAVHPETKNILWQQPIAPNPASAQSSAPDTASLVGGRLVTTYTAIEPKQARLVAFDAKTGGRIFDVPIPRSESGSDANFITVTATRIYVPHWTWLDIFDAKTGAYMQTIGMW
jgi:hypothetical protein